MKKNILYIGNQLAPNGGAPTGIDTLGPLLESEGFTMWYASAEKNKIKRLFHMMYTVWKRRKWVDYVLIDTYSTTNFWYAWIVAHCCVRFNVNYIPILRGGKLPQRLDQSPEAISFLLDNAYEVIAPSRYILEAFQLRGYPGIKCISNNLELKNYRFKPRKEFRPRLFWVRAFSEIYNPLLALKILKNLLKIYPDACLCMIGPDKDGSLQRCRDYAQIHQLPVEFTGMLSKADWRLIASRYDIFLNTTHYDNMPVSMMEAMALGLPVVSTNVGGVPYLVKHEEEALLVPDDKEEAFLEAIQLLIHEPEKAYKMSLLARKLVESYDWENIKKEWFTVLT